ncbi:glycosyltransferase family 2 protein [Sulfobacillus thermosulfidooxidans]|uniref:glycosyltransferase family 2 protein n=1 Tax=Sulfobacillus thermosulfidooxidans TaxID=28034 RepID=UPI0002F8E591|nr:glycosyltransferase family 2 protein [Sulfobacillus thermosulfidooxidans]
MRCVVAMIARNEEETIGQCIESVKPWVDGIIVGDTGSTDNTRRIAREKGAVVIDIPWTDDFSAARNAVLDSVVTDWVLVMDADEELPPGQGQILRELLTRPTSECYDVQILSPIGNGATINTAWVTRLFRLYPHIRYKGAIHEQISQSFINAGMVPANSKLQLWHWGYMDRVWREKNKTARNRHLLLNQVKDHPDDSYSWWQLAVSELNEENWNGAKAALEQARQHNMIAGLAPLIEYVDAKVAWGEQDFRRAIVATQRAESLASQWADPIWLRGEMHRALNNWAAAEIAYHQALKLGFQPESALTHEAGAGTYRSWYGLGATYLSRNEQRRAFATFAVAWQKYPYDVMLWNGICMGFRGQLASDAALELLEIIPNVAELRTKHLGPPRNNWEWVMWKVWADKGLCPPPFLQVS